MTHWHLIPEVSAYFFNISKKNCNHVLTASLRRKITSSHYSHIFIVKNK
jgi:hypothetical protein